MTCGFVAFTEKDMKVSERIRLFRLERGFSQENMADLLHLSTTAYGDIERGKTDLTLSRLTQIADVLDKPTLALLTDEVVPVAQVVPANHELETLRLLVEKQQIEIEKLRLEADSYKRRYDERVAHDLARALGMQTSRERIGF